MRTWITKFLSWKEIVSEKFWQFFSSRNSWAIYNFFLVNRRNEKLSIFICEMRWWQLTKLKVMMLKSQEENFSLCAHFTCLFPFLEFLSHISSSILCIKIIDWPQHQMQRIIKINHWPLISYTYSSSIAKINLQHQTTRWDGKKAINYSFIWIVNPVW